MKKWNCGHNFSPIKCPLFNSFIPKKHIAQMMYRPGPFGVKLAISHEIQHNNYNYPSNPTQLTNCVVKKLKSDSDLSPSSKAELGFKLQSN